MYGANKPRTQLEVEPLQYEIGKNSEVFTKGDLLTIASGVIKAVSGVTDRIVGYANTTMTMTSNNQTVAFQQVPFNPTYGSVLFEMDFDATATQAVVGCYFQIAGATGAQVVTVGSTSATIGQLFCTKWDPEGTGNALRGEFRVTLGPSSLAS